MPLNNKARTAIIVIAVAFLALVGGLVARAHSTVGTENTLSSLESQVQTDRNRGLTISGYYPGDFYGDDWQALGVVCPGATEDELAKAALDQETIDKFNLQGTAVPEDTNYLLLYHTDGENIEVEIDQMDKDSIDLCEFTLAGGAISGFGNVVPYQAGILNFNHADGVSYLLPLG